MGERNTSEIFLPSRGEGVCVLEMLRFNGQFESEKNPGIRFLIPQPGSHPSCRAHPVVEGCTFVWPVAWVNLVSPPVLYTQTLSFVWSSRWVRFVSAPPTHPRPPSTRPRKFGRGCWRPGSELANLHDADTSYSRGCGPGGGGVADVEFWATSGLFGASPLATASVPLPTTAA